MPRKPIMLIFIFVMLSGFLCHAQVIEEIYAIINGEIITLSELQNSERAITFQLSQNYQGDELQKAIQTMKANLLSTIIDQKLLISKAKEKNYEVAADLEMILKEIKKQNNFNSDEELAVALRTQGLTLEDFKEQQKLQHIKRKLIYDEIGSKIQATNAQIMEYYRKNIKNYTIPIKISLNCLYLNKDNYLTDSLLKDKIKEINQVLKMDNFKEIAQKYTELSNSDKPLFLGEFKEGELDKVIEDSAKKLKPEGHSSWLETETGWYIIQLIKISDPSLTPFKDVRQKIANILQAAKQDEELRKYIAELKKEAHIQILKEHR